MKVTPPCGAGSSVVASTAAPSLGTPALSGARQTSVRSAWSATKTVTGIPYCRMYGGLTGIVESSAITSSPQEALAHRTNDRHLRTAQQHDGIGRRRCCFHTSAASHYYGGLIAIVMAHHTFDADI